MKKRIFKRMIVMCALVLVFSMAAVAMFTYHYFEQRSLSMLKSDAVYIARAVEAEGAAYFDGFSAENRITWIAEDGSVLYESDGEAASMENHADRPEVQQARREGEGSAIRQSSTLSSKTLYYALLLKDGSVLRVSCRQASIYRLFFDMYELLFIIAVCVLLFGVVFSYKTAERIVEPINAIDLEHPEQSEAYDELSPLLYRMITQKHNIAAQMLQLRTRQEEMDAILANMREGFLLLDKDRKMLAVNRSAAELFGGKVNQLLGKDLVHLSREEALLSAAEAALCSEAASRQFTRNGRSYEVMAAPVFLSGTQGGATVFVLDVTEKAQAEQLRRQFSANVSHELKTPLTSIAGYAEIIENGMVRPEDIPGFAGRIHEEAKRLVQLVEDLLKLSRLDEGNISLVWEKVDLYALAGQVEDRLGEAAAKKEVTLRREGEAAEIWGVRAVLEEMMYNLCENAVKYNVPGGSVCITVRPEGQRVEVSVRDTGIGIPKEAQEKVFERFYRVDPSHSRQTGGTGLGLSIVKHGASFHHASLELQSEAGKGTEIRLRFPVGEEPKQKNCLS